MGALDKLSSSQIFDINAQLFCLGKYEYFIYKETYQKDKGMLNTLNIIHILNANTFNKSWAYNKLLSMITLNCEYLYELNHSIFDMLFYQYLDKKTLKQQILDLILELNNRVNSEFFPKINTFTFSVKFMHKLKKIISDIYNKNSNITIDWCSYIKITNESITTDEEWNGSQYHQNTENTPLINIKHNIERVILNYNMDICAICCEQINPFQPNIIILDCGHIFHKDKIEDEEITCGGIIDWIFQKNECAICRGKTYCQPCIDYY